MIRTRAKASVLRGLDSNEGLATQLATYQARFGDWRELFRWVDQISKVSKADIRRVSNQIFVEGNRTVGMIETAAPAAPNASKGGAQ
jgi:predicted Zn-dependent peptidase